MEESPPALDAVPSTLKAAQAEHEEVMAEIQQAQQVIQQAQQVIELRTRRGIFLEGLIAGWSKPNRATRRAK